MNPSEMSRIELKQKRAFFTHRIAQALCVDERDLDVNASGQVSRCQQRAIWRHVLSKYLRTCIQAGFYGILFFLPVMVSYGFPGGFLERIMSVFVFAIVVYLLADLEYRRPGHIPRFFSSLRSLWDFQVESVEGIVTRSHGFLRGTGKRRNPYLNASFPKPDFYRLTIGDMTFDVLADTYDAFEDGLPYRLHFTSRTHRVVAAEVLLPDG